jgi:hypothetical protein
MSFEKSKSLPPKGDPMRKIQVTSLVLKYLSTACLLLPIGIFLSVALVPEWLDQIVAQHFSHLRIDTGIAGVKRALLLLLIAAPLGLAIYGLWQVRSLFASFSRGEVFSAGAATYIHRTGIVILASPILNIVFGAIISVLLTYDNPAGSRQLAVSMSSGAIGLVIIGGLLIVIGWTMLEAARLQEENKQFV